MGKQLWGDRTNDLDISFRFLTLHVKKVEIRKNFKKTDKMKERKCILNLGTTDIVVS